MLLKKLERIKTSNVPHQPNKLVMTCICYNCIAATLNVILTGMCPKEGVRISIHDHDRA